jgi:uncharacterized protein YbaA (DUF1428 family)
MYLAVYLYPVLRDRADDFLRVIRAAGDVYVEHGATAVEVLTATELGSAYGCAGLASVLQIWPGERVFVSLDRFRDQGHRDEVMAKVGTDARIDDLYAELADLIDLHRVVRGEFDSVV